MQSRTEAISAPAASALTPAAIPFVSWTERVLTTLGSALDRAMLRALSLAFDTTLMPPREELARIRESAAPYLTPELRRDIHMPNYDGCSVGVNASGAATEDPLTQPNLRLRASQRSSTDCLRPACPTRFKDATGPL